MEYKDVPIGVRHELVGIAPLSERLKRMPATKRLYDEIQKLVYKAPIRDSGSDRNGEDSVAG